MATIKDIIRGLAKWSENLNEQREKQSILIGREALALVRNRVQNKRQQADGSDFGDYSPYYFEQKKKRNQSNPKINLTDTGQMWRDIEVKTIENDAGRTIVEIKGSTPRSEKLIEIHSERFGNILESSDSEINLLEEANRRRILKAKPDSIK